MPGGETRPALTDQHDHEPKHPRLVRKGRLKRGRPHRYSQYNNWRHTLPLSSAFFAARSLLFSRSLAMTAPYLPDVEQARFNMIEQQIRPWNVLDEVVLTALRKVRREGFVPAALRALAFSDLELPLEIDGASTRQTMLSPKLEARLAQSLQLTPSDAVLEIGTGSGYQAALLACLAQAVTSVEIDSRLAAFAQQNLDNHAIGNVKVEVGDGHSSWGNTEYDAILLTGSVPEAPDGLKYQLRVGGRMVVVVGQAPVMTACRITRTTAASFETTPLFDTLIKPLRGVCVPQFKF